MKRKFETEVYVQDRWFAVKGVYYPGYPGNWDNPSEPDGVAFTSVVQFFDEDTEEPWEKDEIFIDEKPDIWLFVERYQSAFEEAVFRYFDDIDYGDGRC